MRKGISSLSLCNFRSPQTTQIIMQTGMKVRLILAGIGIFCGILAGTCFWIMYGNVSATTLAYFSSVCAAFAFYTHWAYHKQWMLQWSSGKIKASIIISKF
uniref:DUF418 domain-containing protein n=1 Tax=Bursaphelenchus xylophilus TaxID=6326 RepID=A0A1I7SHX3_BURXY